MRRVLWVIKEVLEEEYSVNNSFVWELLELIPSNVGFQETVKVGLMEGLNTRLLLRHVLLHQTGIQQ